MPGPGKFKDVSKSAKDIKLGSVSSFKVTMKNKASNGTKVETSQSVAHKDQSVVTALSLKFKKSDGLRLNKIDFDTKGKLAASIAVTNPSPGVDVQLGIERSKGKDAFSDSAFVNVEFSNDLLNFNGKLDFLKQSFNADALVGYENFLVGGKLGLVNKTELKGFEGILGMNFGKSNRFTLGASNNNDFSVAGYFNPAGNMELSMLTAGKTNGTKVATTLAAKFALDNNGTSLIGTLQTTPLAPKDKLRVGLCYKQKLRDYAEIKASGEVGIMDVDFASFGLELTVGDL